MRGQVEAIVPDTNILIRGLKGIQPEEQILQAMELNGGRRVFAVMSPSIKNEVEVVARKGYGGASHEYARMLSIIGLAIEVEDYTVRGGERYPVGHVRDYKIVDAARRANTAIVSEDHDLTDHAEILQRRYGIMVYRAYQYYMDVVRDLLALGVAGR